MLKADSWRDRERSKRSVVTEFKAWKLSEVAHNELVQQKKAKKSTKKVCCCHILHIHNIMSRGFDEKVPPGEVNLQWLGGIAATWDGTLLACSRAWGGFKSMLEAHFHPKICEAHGYSDSLGPKLQDTQPWTDQFLGSLTAELAKFWK